VISEIDECQRRGYFDAFGKDIPKKSNSPVDLGVRSLVWSQVPFLDFRSVCVIDLLEGMAGISLSSENSDAEVK
jgi:hypothetical protein